MESGDGEPACFSCECEAFVCVVFVFDDDCGGFVVCVSCDFCEDCVYVENVGFCEDVSGD